MTYRSSNDELPLKSQNPSTSLDRPMNDGVIRKSPGDIQYIVNNDKETLSLWTSTKGISLGDDLRTMALWTMKASIKVFPVAYNDETKPLSFRMSSRDPVVERCRFERFRSAGHVPRGVASFHNRGKEHRYRTSRRPYKSNQCSFGR